MKHWKKMAIGSRSKVNQRIFNMAAIVRLFIPFSTMAMLRLFSESHVDSMPSSSVSSSALEQWNSYGQLFLWFRGSN